MPSYARLLVTALNHLVLGVACEYLPRQLAVLGRPVQGMAYPGQDSRAVDTVFYVPLLGDSVMFQLCVCKFQACDSQLLGRILLACDSQLLGRILLRWCITSH